MCLFSIISHNSIVINPFKQAVDKRLHALNWKYGPNADDLEMTRKQLMERDIVIHFWGSFNAGKSTLLNALLKARLDCNKLPMCNIKCVQIQNSSPTIPQVFFDQICDVHMQTFSYHSTHESADARIL